MRVRTKTTPRSRVWLVIPALLAGLVVAIAAVRFVRPEPPRTVSEVTREIRNVVLQKSDRPGIEDGGPIGEWWVAASGADIATGEFRDFRLRAGNIRLAARRAQLIVDPDANTISFELHDTVMTRIPEAASDAEVDHFLIELDTFVLGPTRYRRNIVRDGHPASSDEPPSHLAGVQQD